MSNNFLLLNLGWRNGTQCHTPIPKEVRDDAAVQANIAPDSQNQSWLSCRIDSSLDNFRAVIDSISSGKLSSACFMTKYSLAHFRRQLNQNPNVITVKEATDTWVDRLGRPRRWQQKNIYFVDCTQTMSVYTLTMFLSPFSFPLSQYYLTVIAVKKLFLMQMN